MEEIFHDVSIDKNSTGKIVPLQLDGSVALDDLETQSLALLESRASKNLSHRICKVFRNVNLLVYVSIAVVTVRALIVPIFTEFSRVRNIASVGCFGEVVRTST